MSSSRTPPSGRRDYRRRKSIYVVSDATGSTAEKMVRSALIQFSHGAARVRIWPSVRTAGEVEQVVDSAARREALLVYTLVNPALRNHLYITALDRDVEAIDLIGPLLAKLAAYLEAEPQGQPGHERLLDDEYYTRVEAMEFSVKHDDGRNPKNLARADIVLVGVSRTSKTPLSAYLANKGYRVANVPLVEGVDPPQELFELSPGRVFALTIDPQKLTTIRQSRMAQLGVESTGEYADRSHVFREVRWALNLYRSHGQWPIVDVTNRAVEETAAEILKLKAQIEEASAAAEAGDDSA